MSNQKEHARKHSESDDEQPDENKSSKPSYHKIQLPLEDIWRHVPVFPVGVEWTEPHMLNKYNWKFSNLQVEFKEGGVLHGKEKVYLFCKSDPPILLSFNGEVELSYVPAVVVIVSSTLPFDKVIVLRKSPKEVIGMEKANMAWVPFVPLGEWVSSHEIPLPEICVISNVQTKATSEYEFSPSSQQCIPYFYDPYEVDKRKQSSIVDIVYPTEAGTVDCQFDWKLNMLEGFTRMLIEERKLPSDHKDTFKAFVKLKVEEGKSANHEALQKQTQDVEELRRNNKEAAAAFKKMRFYKFYPVTTPDTPDLDLNGAKFAKINRYFGDAHKFF